LGIAGSVDGHISSVSLADVRAISAAEGLLRDDAEGAIIHDMVNRAKLRLLEVTTLGGKRYAFWFPTPHELCAFWNVLLRLTNTEGKQTGLR
jgi:hypothetical protein